MTENDRHAGAFIYARFSTEHQHSVEEQVARCGEFCRQRDIPVLGVYADEAVSGTKLSRQQYDQMMDDLRAGLADCVVIYDQSRLMRDVAGWFGARRALELLGVRVYSATQDYVGGDINKPDTYMMEGIQSIFDTMHVLITREKVTEKLHYMARSGIHTGGRPALGYKTVPAGTGNQKRLVIDEQEARTVRRIFRMYAAGDSYSDIIRALNADGIRTKTGKPFGNNSLHDLLKNKLYTGLVVYGSKVYRADGSRNTHAPEGKNVIERQDETLRIIDQQTFDAVRDKMAQNAHNKPGRPVSARAYPLKGKVFCGSCGAAMAVAASKIKGRTYYYYRCARKDRTHDCQSRPIRCDELEALVVDHVRALIGSADVSGRVLSCIREHAARINSEGLSRQKQISDDLRTVKMKIERILDAIEDVGHTASMKTRLSALEEEKVTLETRLMELERSARVAGLPAARMEEVYRSMIDAARTDVAAVFSIVSRVEVYDDYIRIYTAFDPSPDKAKFTPVDENEPFIIIDGPSSGVPSLIINTCGLVITARRR